MITVRINGDPFDPEQTIHHLVKEALAEMAMEKKQSCAVKVVFEHLTGAAASEINFRLALVCFGTKTQKGTSRSMPPSMTDVKET